MAFRTSGCVRCFDKANALKSTNGLSDSAHDILVTLALCLVHVRQFFAYLQPHVIQRIFVFARACFGVRPEPRHWLYVHFDAMWMFTVQYNMPFYQNVTMTWHWNPECVLLFLKHWFDGHSPADAARHIHPGRGGVVPDFYDVLRAERFRVPFVRAMHDLLLVGRVKSDFAMSLTGRRLLADMADMASKNMGGVKGSDINVSDTTDGTPDLKRKRVVHAPRPPYTPPRTHHNRNRLRPPRSEPARHGTNHKHTARHVPSNVVVPKGTRRSQRKENNNKKKGAKGKARK